MEFFHQFGWAVPRAFADTRDKCQFGRGDILYSKKSDYYDACPFPTFRSVGQIGVFLASEKLNKEAKVHLRETGTVFYKCVIMVTTSFLHNEESIQHYGKVMLVSWSLKARNA